MLLFRVAGVVLVALGAATGVAPRLVRSCLRHGLGVDWLPHSASRVAAWGLVVAGGLLLLASRIG